MKITREGKRFILASVLVAAAALNTGNNLIYLILSLMLSFIIIALSLPFLNLSGLTLRVFAPSHVYAGEKTRLSVLVQNRKKGMSAYSIRVLAPGALSGAYFPVIGRGGEAEKDLGILFNKRGIYGCDDFRVESGFPFILFSRRRRVPASGEVIVYPEMRDVGDLLDRASWTDSGGAVRVSSAGEDTYALREFRYGDDLRRIHWRASAKTEKVMVREYAEFDSAKTTIVLDNLRSDEPGAFETAVSLAASCARLLLGEGHHVRLMSCAKVVPFGGGSEHLFAVLDTLALIAERDAWESPRPSEGDGHVILVLKSPRSPLGSFSSVADMVVYAGDL